MSTITGATQISSAPFGVRRSLSCDLSHLHRFLLLCQPGQRTTDNVLRYSLITAWRAQTNSSFPSDSSSRCPSSAIHSASRLCRTLGPNSALATNSLSVWLTLGSDMRSTGQLCDTAVAICSGQAGSKRLRFYDCSSSKCRTSGGPVEATCSDSAIGRWYARCRQARQDSFWVYTRVERGRKVNVDQGWLSVWLAECRVVFKALLQLRLLGDQSGMLASQGC